MYKALRISYVSALAFLALLVVPTFSYAQNSQDAPVEEVKILQSIAGEERSIQVGRRILFDGSASTNSIDGTLNYLWDFGDGTSAKGVDVTHTYATAGQYTVTLTVDNGIQTDADTLNVTVFEDLMVLISDGTTPKSALDSYRFNAAREGILLSIVELESSEPDYVIEEKLASQLLDKVDDIVRADVILDTTSGSIGLNVLTKFAQEVNNLQDLKMPSKAVVKIADPSASLARIAQSTFNVLNPEYILITGENALPQVWASRGDSTTIVPAVQTTQNAYRLIGKHSQRSVSDFRVWNFMSFAVDFMINRGVPVNTIILILLLPIIATLLAFSRQILGVKAFGIYTPSIITLAFLASGLVYGLVVFLVVLISGSITRIVMKKFRLLFLPRMAIVLTAVALAVIALLGIGARFNQTALVSISIFPILIMISIVEKFVTAQIEKGMKQSLILSLETLVLSIIGYFVLSWGPLRDFVLAYPEIIFVTIVINIGLGKWAGLRLSEYFRFREVRRYLRE